MTHRNAHLLKTEGKYQAKSFFVRSSEVQVSLANQIINLKPPIDLNSSCSEADSNSISSDKPNIPSPCHPLRFKTLLKKTTRSQRLNKNLQFVDTLLILLAVLGLVLEIYNFENNFQLVKFDRYADKTLSEHIRLTNCVLTVLCILLAFFRSLISYALYRERKIIFEDLISSYYRSSSFWSLVIDVMILVVIPPPYWDCEFEFDQLSGIMSINFASLCLSYMMLRLVFLFRLFLYYSKWSTLTVQDTCREYETDHPLSFALKACLMDRPHFLLIPAFAISTLGLGVNLQIFEQTFNDSQSRYVDSSSQVNYSYLYNTMWLVLLTMTTVGYGDTFARTHMGRFISVIAVIWGTFLISLMILMFNNYVVFSRSQEKSFVYLNQIFGIQKIKKNAKKLISKFLLMLVYTRLRGISIHNPQVKKTYKKMLHYRCLFRESIYHVKIKPPTLRDALLNMNDELSLNLSKLKNLLALATETDLQLDSIFESQKKTIESIRHSTRFAQDCFQLVSYS